MAGGVVKYASNQRDSTQRMLRFFTEPTLKRICLTP